MKMNRINKAMVFIAAMLAIVVIGAVVWRYVDNRYLALKEAKPILEKLASGSEDEIAEASLAIRGYYGYYLPGGRTYKNALLEGYKPLHGEGERAVRQLLLDILATSTNRNVLSSILAGFTGLEGEGLDLVNHSEDARNIVANAIDRYNGPHPRHGFKLMQTEDGQWRVANFVVQD